MALAFHRSQEAMCLELPGVCMYILICKTFCRDVPDAFATADDDGDGMQGAGRVLTHQKSKKSQRDPSVQQAEQILAAGSNALMLHQ